MAADIELREMREATPDALRAVATVMGECEAYYRAVHGRPACQSDIDAFFRFNVPGLPEEDVRAYTILADGSAVGIAGLALGWKRPGQSMLGLLAISERHRGRGYARAAYDRLEAIARASPHGTSLRIGVVETNEGAFSFWRHLGFRETGERKRLDEYVADVILLEKAIGG